MLQVILIRWRMCVEVLLQRIPSFTIVIFFGYVLLGGTGRHCDWSPAKDNFEEKK
jgi:hypothetical protein